MGLRISESVKVGPFRVRVSRSLTGKGRMRVGVGTRVGHRGWAGVSEPIGRGKRGG
jgi:hypothetical protein